jgi:poly(beta-D-mannuronate) lyase
MKVLGRFLYRVIGAAMLPVLSACTSAAGDIADAPPLLAPPGYYQPVAVADKKYECPEFPEPYTGPLVFASKYEGDDSSKSHLNKESENRYQQGVKPIRKLENVSAKITRDFIAGSGSDARECLLDLLYAWARQDALLDKEANPIGQAMRKWALATTGAHYLQIMQLDSGLPAASARKRKVIEKWFADLAANVVAYYSNRGPEKANNHDYWAAWAVMLTAVNLQDRELYDWAMDK